MSGLALMLGAALVAGRGHAQPERPAASAPRGVVGSVEVMYGGGVLRAKAAHDPQAPLLARVLPPSGTGGQQVQFMGTVAGRYDLRDLLERADGRPADGLAEITVEIVSNLPADHSVDVAGAPPAPVVLRSRYRESIVGAAALWALLPAVLLGARRMRRRQQPREAPGAPAPATVAEELAVLARSAGARPLTVAENGRLELLLYRYWAQRLGPGFPHAQPPAEMVRTIRQHPDAVALLGALERCLHGREGAGLSDPGAAALLEEFCARHLSARPAGAPGPAGAEVRA